jgi:hypothetical protein
MTLPMLRRELRTRVFFWVLVPLLFCPLAACGKAPSQGTPSSPNSDTGVLTVHIAASDAPSASGAASPTQPVAAAKVTILTMTGQVAKTMTTDAQGAFSTNLAPGNYWVVEPTFNVVGALPQKHLVTITAGKTTDLAITIHASNNGTTSTQG